ncbi:unnamed protein product, partial [Ectocarpus sp. 12 AP-2014]
GRHRRSAEARSSRHGLSGGLHKRRRGLFLTPTPGGGGGRSRRPGGARLLAAVDNAASRQESGSCDRPVAAGSQRRDPRPSGRRPGVSPALRGRGGV